MDFKNYNLENFYDELFLSTTEPRPSSVALIKMINALSKGELQSHSEDFHL